MTEQERFEVWFKESNEVHFCQFKQLNGFYIDKHTDTCWSAWQAATAQAVPEGYVVVPVDALREVLSTVGDALMDESTSSVFDKDGTVSTWYDRYHISEQQLISALEAAQEGE